MLTRAEIGVHVPLVLVLLAVVPCNNDGVVTWTQIYIGGRAGNKNIKTLI